MSYCCYISFKKMTSDEIITFLQLFKQKVCMSLEEIAEQYYAFCPYIGEERKSSKDEIIHTTQTLWAHKVFTFRFFYDKERELLGVFSVPDTLRYLFDGTVYFQNSCDQDYEREEYNHVQKFEEIYDNWMKKSTEEIYELCKKDVEEWNKDEEMYYRRTYAYDEISTRYEDELYNDEKALYFSLFKTFYEEDMIITFLKYCREKMQNSRKLL